MQISIYKIYKNIRSTCFYLNGEMLNKMFSVHDSKDILSNDLDDDTDITR